MRDPLFVPRRRLAMDRTPEDRNEKSCYAVAIPLIAAAVSAGAQIYSSNKAASTASAQMDLQKQQIAATTSAPQAQQAKGPSQDTANAAAGIGTGTNALGTGNFNSNTLLTGSQGVTDPLSLSSRKLYGNTPQTTNLLGA